MEENTVSIIIPARTKEEIKFPQGDYEIIPAVGKSLKEARKEAIMKARGKYILLLDSDQILGDKTSEQCLALAEEGFEGITLTEKSLTPTTWLQKVIAYDKDLFHSAQDDDPMYGAAEPRFFRSSYLKQLDFDKLPPLTFELTFINKQVRDMGAKMVFSKAEVYHNEPKTISELFRKFFRYGYYYIPALRLDPEITKAHSRPRRVYFTGKALSRPLLYCGLWLHYLVKGLASTLGAGLWLLHSLRE
jgi:hypothetical protein